MIEEEKGGDVIVYTDSYIRFISMRRREKTVADLGIRISE